MELTDAGWQAWQDSTGAQAQKEALLASALDPDEKDVLNGLLRRLMLEFEQRGGKAAGHGAEHKATGG